MPKEKGSQATIISMEEFKTLFHEVFLLNLIEKRVSEIKTKESALQSWIDNIKSSCF